ncbi:MAG: hypothetical protein AB7E55_14595 [Pigmentiphaga sp.]
MSVLAALLLASPLQANADTAVATDKLSGMFIWWNHAMKTPGGFTAAAFSNYFTDEAPLIIDGVEVMRGPAGWAERFQMIQGATEAVEIVVPFRYSFQKDDRIYTYHIIRSRAQGKVSCMLASGHAELRNGLISRVILVRAEIDPASDPDCWKQ